MNYYELLGISQTATEEEIKKAYKREMKKWHPDINKDEQAVSMSIKINEAKDVLLDEVKRKAYDESLKEDKTKTYEKYSSPKKETKDYTKTYNDYSEPKTVTKWQYLKDYLKYGNINIIKKVLIIIAVLLESFICTALKYLVIALSFLCFILTDVIISLFNYLFPIILLLIIITLYSLTNNNINNNSYIISLIVIISVFISSFILPVIGKLLISPRVFYFLYNNLDIYLFKKIVGYK